MDNDMSNSLDSLHLCLWEPTEVLTSLRKINPNAVRSDKSMIHKHQTMQY